MKGNPTEHLVSALREGKQITNGPQSISYAPELDCGYLTCDAGCCDATFDGMPEIVEFIDGSDWEIVER